MAALEAEVKAESDAARARKDAALAKLRAQRAAAAPAPAQQALVKRKPRPDSDREDREDDDDAGASRSQSRSRSRGPAADLGGALELADKLNRTRAELARKPAKGEKSWLVSGVASLALGPVGWLYAGSWREAVPAATIWVLIAALAGKILPTLLLWPALMVVMPLSAIAGAVYALQYNRHGGRQRIFDRDDKDQRKQLKSGRDG